MKKRRITIFIFSNFNKLIPRVRNVANKIFGDVIVFRANIIKKGQT